MKLETVLQGLINRLEILERTPQSGFSQITQDLVSAQQSTTSLPYVDLATPGPSVEVDITQSGKLYVCCTALITPSSGDQGRMAPALTGANVVAASSTLALILSTLGRSSFWGWFEGLDEGLTTVTAKYRTTSGGSAAFADRSLIAIPV